MICNSILLCYSMLGNKVLKAIGTNDMSAEIYQNIVAIWCRDLDNLIGVNNDLPWHHSEDLKRFKRITDGKTLIMGKNTYESLPNRTLPNRKIIVITKDKNYTVSNLDNHTIGTICETGLKFQTDNADYFRENSEYYVCGGAEIYKQFMQNEKLRPEYIIDNVIQKHHPEHHEKGIFLDKGVDDIIDQYYTQYEVDLFGDIRVNLHTKIKKLSIELEDKIRGEIKS